jgi:hypothetical protein
MAKVKALATILNGRRKSYTLLVDEALKVVYSSGDLNYIAQVEEQITEFAERIKEGNLEKISKEEAVVEIDSRPMLNAELYIKEREAGLNETQIGEKYQLENPHFMKGCRFQYTNFKRNKSSNVKNIQTEQEQKGNEGDDRPLLNSTNYRQARDAGMSNDEIKERYRLSSRNQINGLASQYTRLRGGK